MTLEAERKGPRSVEPGSPSASLPGKTRHFPLRVNLHLVGAPLGRDAMTVTLMMLAGSLIAWVRLSATTRGTLWAEDSRDFLGHAVTAGPITPLFTVYAGYLHTVPRLLTAGIVTLVPIGGWAQAMTAGSCLVAAAVAVTVFFCSRTVTDSWLLRLALASITILDPLAPREVLGNAANLHWYFLWLAPWLILYRSPSRRGTIALTIVAALAALTEIQMLLFVPLLLLRWKSGARLPVRLALLGGGLAQALSSMSAPRVHSTAVSNDLASVVYGYFINSAMTIWQTSGPAIGRALVQFGPTAALACFLPIVAAVVWTRRRGTRDQRWMVVVLSLASMATWGIAVKTNPAAFYDYSSETPAQLANPWLSRYGVVPSMDLLAVMVIALGMRRKRSMESESSTCPRRVVGVRMTAGFVLAVLVLTSFGPGISRRSGGPTYASQVEAAEQFCIGQPPTTPVVLAAPPQASWKIYLDCSWIPSSYHRAPPLLRRDGRVEAERGLSDADLANTLRTSKHRWH